MPDTDLSFFVHRGSRSRRSVESFLEYMRASHPSWRIGAAVRLPRESSAYQEESTVAFAAHADYVLADPETRLMHLPFDNRGKGRRDYRYLAESDPAANRRRFTEQVLEAQIRNGRDVLISPWLIHNLSGTTRELLATAAFAAYADSSPTRGEHKLLLGFEATENVIAQAETRNAFLNELVEAPAHPIYLRMTASAAVGPTQYAHEPALRGLRAVTESLADNQRALLLPQSGLCGWLMQGFGAGAFGAGVQFSMQRAQTLRTSGGGGGGAAPLHWYFWPQFIGFVLAEEIAQLSAVTGAEQCPCPFCQDSPPVGGFAFNREAAEKHFLWWCVYLADEVRNANDQAQVIRDRLTAAESYWTAVQAAGVPLDDRSKPQHLEAWSRVMA
jgi:hypothetical protein